MERFHIVEPEVAGGWGANMVAMRTPGLPVVVTELHYEFDGWLGDELLETTPCFVATERLAEELRRAGLTGLEFDVVKVTASQQFLDLHPGKPLPRLVWLKLTGAPGQDDFGLTPDLMLVTSGRALDLMAGKIPNALISPYAG